MKLVILGYGYTAQAAARLLGPRLSQLTVTARTADKVARLGDKGIPALRFDGEGADAALIDAIRAADAVLASIPPGEGGDPALHRLGEALRQAGALRHVVYLSTIGVYGDFEGAWVDETTVPKGDSPRARRRLLAEGQWLALGRERGLNVQVLRLAGIYGPGRNPLVDLAEGVARRLLKPGQVFNRIHVEDIARAVAASLDHREPGEVWNVTDDEPAPPQEVVAFAAELLGLPAPPLVDYETAELSEMARAFYSENKRVSNRRLRHVLGVNLAYPSYREGLRALHAAGEGAAGSRSQRAKRRP